MFSLLLTGTTSFPAKLLSRMFFPASHSVSHNPTEQPPFVWKVIWRAVPNDSFWWVSSLDAGAEDLLGDSTLSPFSWDMLMKRNKRCVFIFRFVSEGCWLVSVALNIWGGGFMPWAPPSSFAKHSPYKMTRCIRYISVLTRSLLTKVICDAEVFDYFIFKPEVYVCSILDLFGKLLENTPLM